MENEAENSRQKATAHRQKTEQLKTMPEPGWCGSVG